MRAASSNLVLNSAPYPLGASVVAEGTSFAVFAGNATEVELCLFDATGRREITRVALPECTDGVWHGCVPGIAAGQIYGFRAHGPYDPERGHRYNANKLLLDPYARALSGSLRWSDALYGYRPTSPRGDLSIDRRDSAFAVPKAVVTLDQFEWGDDRAPRTPWSDTVIYEAHLRGLTMRLEDIAERERGTAAALGSEAMVNYLRNLGITALELLPIHAMVHDRVLVDHGLVNYWGYNTLAYFAPEPRYLATGGLGELKGAIKALHAAGIEVLLDVVYNHTCEGSELGPTLSLRGLDNSAYYRLMPGQSRQCINDTGCGNTVNFSHPRVIQLVLDSLRYWVSEFHIDGFRFDLGVTLGRETSGFDPGSGFFDALMQDPMLSRVKLISEPWDLGPGGYQLGRQPAGMAEWNAQYRDDVRKFWRGDAGLRGALAARLQGSADLFDHDHRKPWASLNFIAAHDGFTLQDLVSYNSKHNEANGEDNRDGSDDNGSSNCGVEGPSDDAAVMRQRESLQCAMLSTLLLSHGTPMLLGGDEFGRTQRGNNNAYCQDSELSWFDWALAHSSAGRARQEFVARLLRLRAQFQSLRVNYFQHGRLEPLPEVRDIEWFDDSGDTMRPEDWHDAHGRLLSVRRVVRLRDGRAEASLLLINNQTRVRSFQLPQPQFAWWLRLDSADLQRADHEVHHSAIEVAPHSVQLLTAIVEAPNRDGLLHAASDTAAQPTPEPLPE
jgi:glycogen operon protein